MRALAVKLARVRRFGPLFSTFKTALTRYRRNRTRKWSLRKKPSRKLILPPLTRRTTDTEIFMHDISHHT